MPTPYLSRLKLEKELEKKAKLLREKKEKCDSLMENIDKHFSLMEGKVPVDDFKKEYEKGKELYDMKDMDGAIEIFEKLNNELSKKVKEIYDEEKKKIETILDSISGEDAAKIKADLSEGEEKIESEPERSFEILKETQERLDYVIEEGINHITRELKEVMGNIDGLQWVKEEVDKIEEGKKDSETLLKLKEIQTKAVEEINDKVKEYIDKTHKIIDIASSAHFNLPVDKSAEEKIKDLVDSGNYSAAIQAGKEYLESAKKSFDFFFKKLYDIAKRIADEGKGMELDISEPSKYLEDANKKYEEEDFEGAVELIKKATEEAEKMKFQRVMEVIKEARELFLDAKEHGIDINPFLEKIDNARNFLKIGKNKRAYDIVLETIDMVKRKKDLYNQLKEEIKRIKSEIEDLGKENIVLEGVDESIKSIEETLENNPDKAEKMLNELIAGIKISLRDIAQALYNDLSSIIEKAENEKMAVEDLKLSMEDAKAQIGDENYKEAIIALRKVEEDIYTRIEDHIKELRDKTEKYKDARLEESFNKIREFFESGDIDGVFNELSNIKDITFEMEGREYQNKIKEMRNKVEFLHSAGGNTTEVLSYIERAEVALKKKDIVKADDYLSRGAEALKSLQSLVAKDVFDSAKIIAAAAKRLGVDIGKQRIMELLKKAKESIEKEDYEGAIKYSMDAKNKAKDLRDKAEKAYSQLVNAAKIVAKLKDMGANVNEVAKLLVDAKKNFENNNFEDAEKLSIECVTKAESMENRARVEHLRRELDNIGKVMRELGLGNEFKKKTKEFYSKYEDMKYDNLVEYGEKILSELREHVETILTDYIGKIETDIYDAKGKGYELNINLEDLENAKDLFIKRKYLDSLYILKKLESQIVTIYEKNEKMAELQSKIKKYMNMAISLGIDVSPYNKELEELSKYTDMRKIEKETNRITKEIENALYKKVRALITNVEKELDARRRRGEDVTAPESILNKAKSNLKEKNYVEALNKVMTAVGEIEKYEIQKNTAYGILKRLEVKIKAMNKILPKDIITEYEYAKKLFLKGLYEQSIERSMKVSDKVSEIERVINYIKEKNKEIRDMVMKAHRLGMDVKEVLRVFNHAKEEFKNMHYQESLKLVDQCYTEAKLLMIDAVNKYKSAYSRMTTLIKRIGLEDDFKDSMREMDKLFEEGEYEKIKVKLSEMKKELNERLAKVSDNIMKEFSDRKRIFKELNVDVGIDLEQADMKLREYRAKDYTKFFEYASMLNERMEKVMPILIKKKIEELKAEFDKYEKYGVNMDEYHSKLYEILSMMEEKEYQEIFSMLENVENNFRRYLDEYIKSLEERVKKRVGDYSEDKAKEYVDRIEKMRRVGNYAEAIKIYHETNDFIARYKVFMEDFGKRVEEVKDRLRFALSLGLKVGDLITKLREIEEKAPNDMEKAKIELEDLKSKLNIMIDALEPKLDIGMEIGEESEGKYAAKLILENKGDVDAQNIKMNVKGAYIAKEPVEVLKIEKGSRAEIDTFLERGKGNKVNISGNYYRFDGKEYNITKEIEIKVEEKKEESKGYHIEKAKKKEKCAFCRGTILPGMDMAVCDNCGATYHVPCAKRVKKCKVCGQKFKFD